MFGQKAVKTYVAFLFALLMIAWATPEEYVATGGSKANGTVSWSCEYSIFQSPKKDCDQVVDLLPVADFTALKSAVTRETLVRDGG